MKRDTATKPLGAYNPKVRGSNPLLATKLIQGVTANMLQPFFVRPAGRTQLGGVSLLRKLMTGTVS